MILSWPGGKDFLAAAFGTEVTIDLVFLVAAFLAAVAASLASISALICSTDFLGFARLAALSS